MTGATRTWSWLAFAAAVAFVWGPSDGFARSKRGVKRLAMKRFDVGSRDVSVIATARSGTKGGAAIVRLKNADVPVCYLLLLDAAPRKAKAVKKAFRTGVCAAYDKHARSARLKSVALTTRRNAWRVFVLSKRVDALAKGQETRRLWALYSDDGAAAKTLFERTSTAFESKSNRAFNQAEVCEAPSFPVADTPTTLVMNCDSASTLEGRTTTKRNTFKYAWSTGRFVLR